MKLATERDKVAHLLRRFGLGASEAELDYYGKNGLSSAIDLLLHPEKVPTGPQFTAEQFYRNDQGMIRPQTVRQWWTAQILTTTHPLVEKMTLFWHDHFATSGAKVNSGPLMKQQNDLLREHALGKFPELLAAASKDPAMLYWLDGQFNVKGKPNENFAREVMELFTLGVGNYTEKDVQEAARAFTGWTYRQPRRVSAKAAANAPRRTAFVFDESLHDETVKTILGKTGNFDGDDVLAILCDHIQTARYITGKILAWFVVPNPSPSMVDKFATVFRRSGLDIKALLKAIMESPEFYSDAAVRTLYKNPIDFTVSALRAIGAANMTPEGLEAPLGRLNPAAVVSQCTKAMGMELVFPPDVAGWEGGAGWVSSATMVERIKFADRILAGRNPGSKVPNLNFDASFLINGLPVEEAVRKLVSVFDAPLPEAKIRALADAARKIAGGNVIPDDQVRPVAVGVTRMIFGSPEFQFS
jgi:uncharacterized protein (DUF1800 family)